MSPRRRDTDAPAAVPPAGSYPTDDEVIRRTYALMVTRGGDPTDLFRQAEQELLALAAHTVCRAPRRP